MAEEATFDWSAHYDEEGKLYYYNSKTEESSWDPPEEGFNPAEENAPEDEEAKTDAVDTENNEPAASVSGWTAHKDEEGNEYYYNETTGETQWEKPEDLNQEASEEANGDSEHKEESEKIEVQGEDEEEKTKLGSSEPDEKEGDGTQQKWTVHTDDEGNTYYYCAETGDTQWDKPDGVIVEDSEEPNDNSDQPQEDVQMAEAEDKQETHEASDKPVEGADESDKQKWTAHKDDEGNEYYFCAETNETQWEKPNGVIVVEASEEPNDAADQQQEDVAMAKEDDQPKPVDTSNEKDSNDGPRWTVHKDDEGNEYYYCAETGETQWEKPDGVIVDGEVEGGEKTADGTKWVAYTDDEGREYYFNQETEETVWEKPEEMVAAEAAVTEETDDDDKKAGVGESVAMEVDPEEEPEPEEEIDPAVKRLQDAEAFLNQTDAILEPGCFTNVAEVVASQDGNPAKAMTALVENYQSQTAVCGLLARWLSNMKSASASKPTKEESSEATNDDIRKTAQEVINRVAKERFSKETGDKILTLEKSQAAFLGQMMSSSRWRSLLIDLSATHKDSAVLVYCLRTISKRGHHREIARRINQSDHFAVFRQMLQSELTVIGKLAVSSGTDVKTSIGMEELINDLRRACTATSYTYVYSLEVLRALECTSGGMQDASEKSRRAFRKWEVLREDLENTMQDPAVSASFSGPSPLFRKRRLDIAMTINELRQRQRRRFVPPNDAADERNGLDGLESALLKFIRRHATGVQVDDSVLDAMLPSGLDLESNSKHVGALLVRHPLAIRAMLGSLFKPGAARATSPVLKNKCARLIALSVVAAEESCASNDHEHKKSDEVAVTRMILEGCKLCEQLEIMVSFLVSDGDRSKTSPPSPGRKLCTLAMQSAVVAQGTMIWAKELTGGPDFAVSASFPTLSVSILSLVRRIALEQPFARRDALSTALTFTKQANSDVTYQKLNAIKEQSIRLMLCLMTKGESRAVLDGVGTRLQQQPELDASLVRYFVAGVLEIVKVPVSLAFARVFTKFLRVSKCVDAVRSSYFVEPHQTRLSLLLKSFKQLVADTDGQEKVDKSWLESVLSTYRLE